MDTDRNSWEGILLLVLLRHTQSSRQVGSWHHTRDWGNSSAGGWVPKTLSHCLFCAQEGALTSQPELGHLCGLKGNEIRNWVDSDCEALVTSQTQGRRIRIPGLVGTHGPHSGPSRSAMDPAV